MWGAMGGRYRALERAQCFFEKRVWGKKEKPVSVLFTPHLEKRFGQRGGTTTPSIEEKKSQKKDIAATGRMNGEA